MHDQLEPIPEAIPVDPGTLVQGILIGLGWNGLALLASLVLMAAVIGIFLVAGFGLVQFAWIIPISRRYRNMGKTETAKGILIAGGISVLLSACCWGSLGNTRFR